MREDTVDRLVSQWATQRPELDLAPMATVARLARVWQVMQGRVSAELKRSGLQIGEFDVLATLRRSGPPFRLSPTAMVRNLMLSPAAMTNRLDRLEGRGLVRRLPDPDDRRALLIELTDAGFTLVDDAVEAHIETERECLASLSPEERLHLDEALRTLLQALGRGD